METALGAFHWSPDQFWSATPAEFYAAYDHFTGARAKRKKRHDRQAIMDGILAREKDG